MSNQSGRQDRADMARALPQIKATLDAITTERGALTDDMNALFATWQGSAKEAFKRQYGTFDEAFGEANRDLTEIHTLLEQSLADYTRSEAEQESTAQSMSGAINYQ